MTACDHRSFSLPMTAPPTHELFHPIGPVLVHMYAALHLWHHCLVFSPLPPAARGMCIYTRICSFRVFFFAVWASRGVSLLIGVLFFVFDRRVDSRADLLAHLCYIIGFLFTLGVTLSTGVWELVSRKSCRLYLSCY